MLKFNNAWRTLSRRLAERIEAGLRHLRKALERGELPVHVGSRTRLQIHLG
jgi:hypothetical protein